MTFTDVVTEICTRVNDPDKDTYGLRAESAFLQAICELAISEETQLEEIQELVQEIEASDNGSSGPVDFVGGEAAQDIPYGTLKVIDVYITPEDLVNTELTLKEVTHDEIKRTKLEPSFLPGGNECFWYRVKNQIRFLLSGEWGSDDAVGFRIQAIVNPESTEWGEEDLTSDRGYSLGFLYRCIDNAVAKIRLEIAGA